METLGRIQIDCNLIPPLQRERKPELHPKFECSHILMRVAHKVSAHHLQIDIIAQCHEKSWTHPDKLSFDSTLLPERQPELHPKLECSHNLMRVTHKVSDHHLEINIPVSPQFYPIFFTHHGSSSSSTHTWNQESSSGFNASKLKIPILVLVLGPVPKMRCGLGLIFTNLEGNRQF